jgi:hypothetical protein
LLWVSQVEPAENYKIPVNRLMMPLESLAPHKIAKFRCKN